MSDPIEIFFSYAHEDEASMNDIRRQLVVFDRIGMIRKWHDRLIPPGVEWRGQIDARLHTSNIILLLVSPDFFESDYCYDTEMTEALRRHEAGTARVIPIIVRPCLWEMAPFARLQSLLTDARPISLWPDRDEACRNVADGIMQVVRELRGEGAPPAPDSRTYANDAERLLAVRVHRAWFQGDTNACYFINLTNLSPRRAIEVTHVWYEDGPQHIPIIQRSRALPVRLEPDQSWETWIEESVLANASPRADTFQRFRARISTGAVFTSSWNDDVPAVGTVPGGPIHS
jgi:hypothetical protein